MLKPFIAEEFQQNGLLPFHFQFAKQYSEPNSQRFWSLVAPPGTGKTRMAAFFVAREMRAAGAARVLVLAPSALLVQWREEIARLHPAVAPFIVDRKRFLELEAETASDQELWPQGAVIVMSVDLAKRHDISESLVSTVWSLVVWDESHVLTGQRLDLFRAMMDADSMHRALLLTSLPKTTFDGVAAYEVNMSETTDWNGRQVFPLIQRSVTSISYDRSHVEATFLHRLVDVCRELADSFPAARLQQDVILRAASSATYTAETGLRRLLEAWSPVTNRLTHDIVPSAADLDWIQLRLDTLVDETTVEPDSPEILLKDTGRFRAALSAVQLLLESIDDIAVDSKLEALVHHLQSDPDLRSKHTCIVTSFRSTAEYLSASLRSLQVPVFCITGSVDLAARAGILDQFKHSAGIMIMTDGALAGMNLQYVSRCINYDLPLSHTQWRRRWSRFGLGRHTLFEVIVLEDRSKSFDWEDRLLAQFLNEVRGS